MTVHTEPSDTVMITPALIVIGPAVIAFSPVGTVYDSDSVFVFFQKPCVDVTVFSTASVFGEIFGVIVKLIYLSLYYLYCTSSQQSADPIVFVGPVDELQIVIPAEKNLP